MTNTKNSLKYHNACQFIEENEDIKRSLRGYKSMLSSTLYAALAAVGVKWDFNEQLWKRKSDKHHDSAARKISIKAKTNARRDKVLVRIITHRAVRDSVVSEFTELIEALNYTLDSVSDGYENADGDYVRTYINLRRNVNG